MRLQMIIRQWRKAVPYKDAIIFIGLVIFVAIFYTSQIGGWFNLPYRPESEFSDLTITFFPNITYIKQVISEYGQFPLWRTLLFGGSPLDSDPQAGIWYPPNVIFLFMPAEIGFNVLIVLHLVLGGMGMWKWGEAVKLSVWGRLFAVSGFILMPKMIAHLGFGHLGLFYAANYLPWLFWALKIVISDGLTASGRLAGIWGLQFLANPQLAFYGAMACMVYALLRIAILRRSNLLHEPHYLSGLAKRFIFVAFLSGLIIAVQLIPMLKYAPLSGRSAMQLEDSAISSLPLNYLWGFLIHDRTGYMEYMTYIGFTILVFAIFSFKNPKAKIAGAIGVAALVFAMGIHTPFYGILFRLIPFLGWVRSPARILFVVNSVLILLAGKGLDIVLEAKPSLFSRFGKLLLFGLMLIPLMVVMVSKILTHQVATNVAWFGIISALTFGTIWISQLTPIPKTLFAVLILIFSVADLWFADASLIEGRKVEQVMGNHEVVEFLAARKKEPFRVYSPSYSINRLAGSYYQIESADGVDPLYWTGYDRFMQFASGVSRTRYEVTIPAMEGGGDVSQVNRNAIPNARMLGLINVKYVAAEFPINAPGLRFLQQIGTTYIYQNDDYLPRWTIAFKIKYANDFDSALRLLRNNIETATIVEEPVHSMDIPLDPSIHGQYSITPVQITPNRVVFNVDMEEFAGYFVLRQTWHPDWKVYIDKAAATLVRIDGVNMGVYIKGGHHLVEFAYQPKWTYFGGTLTVLGWFVIFFLCCRSMQRKSTRTGHGKNRITEFKAVKDSENEI